MPTPDSAPIPVSNHPPSVPVGHSPNEPDTRPTSGPPSLARQAWNLARSLTDFVADGCKTVTKEQYQERLEICDGCDHRRANRCMKCGCRLSLKAQGRAFKCPAGKWPANRLTASRRRLRQESSRRTPRAVRQADKKCSHHAPP